MKVQRATPVIPKETIEVIRMQMLDRKKRFLIFAVLLFCVQASTAQDETIRALVSRLQGRGVYLNVGREVGFIAHDTLSVVNTGEETGVLRVIGTSTGSSLTTWVGRAFELAVGDTVFVRRISRPSEPSPIVPPADVSRQSILTQTGPDGRVGTSKTRTPVFRGRILLSLSGMRSTTNWKTSVTNRKTRTFATPTLSFRGSVSRLPGDMTLSVNSRVSYRYSTNGIIDQPTSIRLYQISMSRSVPGTPIVVEAGRFSNANEPGIGYWDGVSIRRRSRDVEFGLAVGLEPDRFNEGFQSDIPKYSAYVSVRPRIGAVRMTSEVSFTQLRPRNGWLTHTYIGLEHRIRARAVTLGGDLQLDRDHESDQWVVTRMKARGSVRLPSNLSINVRYSIRQPYAYWKTSGIISYRRDQATVGLNYGGSDARMGVSVTTNRVDSDATSTTYSMNFSIPSLPLFDLGLSGSASYWSRLSSETVYGTLNLSKRMRSVRVQLMYNYYEAALFSETLISHTVGASVQIKLRKDMHASVQSRTQFGQQLTSTSFFASLWVSF